MSSGAPFPTPVETKQPTPPRKASEGASGLEVWRRRLSAVVFPQSHRAAYL